MPITQAQYDAVEAVYRERRQRARGEAALRAEKIAAELPELAEREQERLKLSMELIRTSLGTDTEKAERLRARMQAISAEKEALLASRGYTLKDLEPHYTCPFCGDTGRYEGRACRCYDQVLAEVTGHGSVREDPVSFDDFSLAWYDNTAALRDFGGQTERQVMEGVLAAAKAYADRFSEKKEGLFLTGPVGTGKTLLSRCIAHAVERQGYEVCLVTAQEFFRAAEAEAFDKENDNPLLLGQMNRADLLVIDDLGTEFTSRRLAQNALFTMINERELKERGTILTGNLSLNDMEDLYSNRVSSRIAGTYRILRFAGPDIRIAKKQFKNRDKS